MRARLAPVLLLALLGLFTTSAFAQEAQINGAIVDGTKAALPGATVTATSLETGRTVVAISDARGEYRLREVPPGRYKLQAELAGFSTVVIPELEVLVGQNRTIPFTMQV